MCDFRWEAVSDELLSGGAKKKKKEKYAPRGSIRNHKKCDRCEKLHRKIP